MENSLIVLIFIASIVYKIYTNYKKEAEKARQRNPQQRPYPNPTYNHQPIKDIRENTTFFEDKVSYTSQENNLPDEVRRVVDSKKKAISTKTTKEEKTETIQERFPFDLKQAVLQSAILDRPYK